MDIRDYFRILKRKKTVFSLTFLLCLASYGLAAYFRSHRFTASARYILKRSEYTQALLSSLITPPTLSINTQLELIKSRVLQERAYELLKKQLPRSPWQTKAEALNFLAKNVTASQVGESDIVEITAAAPSARLARATAQAVAEATIAQINQLLSEELSQAQNFLEQNIASQEAQLSRYREEKQQFLRSHGLVNMDVSLQVITQRLAQLNTNFEEAKLALERQDLFEKVLASRLNAIPSKLAQTDVVENPEFAQYREQLLNLKLQLLDLRERYTDAHPAVQAIVKKMGRIKKAMQTQVAKHLGVERKVQNPLFTALQERLIDAQMKKLDNNLSLALYQKLYAKEKEKLDKVSSIQSQYADIEHKLISSDNLVKNLKEIQDKVRLSKLLGQKEASIYEPASQANPIHTVTPASMGLALFLSLFVGIAFATVAELLDERVRTSHTAKKILGVPVLGAIPFLNKKNGDVHIEGESYRKTAFHFRKEAERHNVKSALITSLRSQEGKTSLTVAISRTLAQEGKNILLIDGDLRKARVHKILRLDSSPGLSDLIGGKREVESQVEAIKEKEPLDREALYASCIQKTDLPSLSVVASGSHISSPAEFLGRFEGRLLEFLQWAKGTFDFVLLDSPPFLPVIDASIYASCCDALLLVIDGQTTYKKDLTSFRSLASAAKIPLLGSFLNKLERESEDYYYYYYRSYYYHTKRR